MKRLSGILLSWLLILPAAAQPPDTLPQRGDSTGLHSRFQELFTDSSADAAEIASAPKFWFIQDIWQGALESGMSQWAANAVSFLTICVVLIGMVWLVNRLIFRFVATFIRAAVKKTRFRLDDILLEHRFFRRVLYLIPQAAILFWIQTFFRGFDPKLILTAQLIVRSVIAYIFMLICFSLLDTLQDVYMMRPAARRRSIKGYIQVGKIVLAFLAGIIILAILLRRDPTKLLVGLGAAAAVLSLVFKDTILGFVASIQLSAQDMVRPGDWISMPSKGADGIVLDLNVNSVKVQNWDNTLTMIPIYSMVSEAFVNWRGMETSGGRQFIFRYLIDLSSVVPATDEILNALSRNPVTAPTIEKTIRLARNSSPQILTNLALYRAHLHLYLFRNPRLNPELMTYVHYLSEVTEKGLILEVCGFSRHKSFYGNQTVTRAVMEYVLVCAPIFGIRLFQSPSGETLTETLQEIEKESSIRAGKPA